jgi:hypothetical protein
LVVQISADLNGDGVHDEAILLRSETSSEDGLWVLLSRSRGARQWINLAKITSGSYLSAPLVMAIEHVPPGTYDGCFEFVKKCDLGAQEHRPKFSLSSPAIVHYKPEGAASMYFWSGKDDRFIRVWLND